MRKGWRNSKKTEVDGIIFDSGAEALRYRELKLLAKAGKIKELVLQPKFVLIKGFKYNGETIRQMSYFADFMYYDFEKKKTIIEDVKGYRERTYINKRKLFLRKLIDGDYENEYGKNLEFVEVMQK